MLDQLLELFERDESNGRQKPGGRRSFKDRLFGNSDSDDREDRSEDSRSSDDQQNQSTSQNRKPTKRDRLADLFEME